MRHQLIHIGVTRRVKRYAMMDDSLWSRKIKEEKENYEKKVMRRGDEDEEERSRVEEEEN